jgi:hypothetical protein
MKQAMMQRYLDFMSVEISNTSDSYSTIGRYILKNKNRHVPEELTSFRKWRDKLKYRENNMSYIQTQVKRAIAGTGEITQAVAQGMEKQIAILIKVVVEDRDWLKNNKFSYRKIDYIAVRNQYKSRLSRLVELQQAIRKEKQKGKYE